MVAADGHSIGHFNPRQIALYTGLQLGRLGAMLELFGQASAAADLRAIALSLELGSFNAGIRTEDSPALLANSVMASVYGLALIRSQGADLPGALNAGAELMHRQQADKAARQVKMRSLGRVVTVRQAYTPARITGLQMGGFTAGQASNEGGACE